VTHYTASHAGSGLASAVPGDVTPTDGPSQGDPHTSFAVAGNTKTAGVSGLKQDTIAPTFSAAATFAPAASGWYNIATGPAVIHYTASDAGSPYATLFRSNKTLTDGPSQGDSQTIFDLAGNSKTAGVSGLKQDTIAPTFSAAATLAPAASGWYNIATGPAVIHYTASDAGSGLASAVPGDVTLTDGPSQGDSQTIFDLAGNSKTAGVSGLKQDTVAPTFSAAATFAPAASGSYNIATGAAVTHYTASDAGSGLASPVPGHRTLTRAPSPGHR